MFDTLCTYPLTSDLFTQTLHPTTSLLALGLLSGHVQLNRLPPPPNLTSETHHGEIETVWRTCRHKGSCRSLCFSADGTKLFAAGTDGLVKAAETETGVVGGKIGVPLVDGRPDPPTLLHALTRSTLLLATDSSALHLYDLRSPSHFPSPHPQQTHHPHSDYISSLTPLTPSAAGESSHQFLTTGGTTVAVTDLRRGVLVRCEDQGEELLSSTLCGGKAVVGVEKGGLRVWDVGVWDDNEEIVSAGGDGGAEVLSAVPGREGMVAVGMDNGCVRFVGLGGGGEGKGVRGEVRHDEVEGVGGLGFEVGGRMISGGGGVVKVWEESTRAGADEGEVEAVEAEMVNGYGGGESVEGGGSSEEEEKPRKRVKKKRKKGKGKGTGGGQHVMGFMGMD